MITELALKIIIFCIAFYLMAMLISSIIMIIQEVKDKMFLDYLKDNDRKKYERVVMEKDNPDDYRTILHAYRQQHKQEVKSEI